MCFFVFKTSFFFIYFTSFLLVVNGLSICKLSCNSKISNHLFNELRSDLITEEDIQKYQKCDKIYNDIRGLIYFHTFACSWSNAKQKYTNNQISYAISYFTCSNLNRKSISSFNIAVLINNCIIEYYYVIVISLYADSNSNNFIFLVDAFNINQIKQIIHIIKLKSNIIFVSSLQHLHHSYNTSVIIDILLDQSESEKQMNIYYHLFYNNKYFHLLPFNNNQININKIYSLYISENDNLDINEVVNSSNYEDLLLYIFFILLLFV